MACTNLPQELIDHVHDFLSDDKNALLSCSLVCKAWVHPARKHLFFELELKPADVVPVINSSSAVIPFVRHLILKTTEPLEGDSSFMTGFRPTRVPSTPRLSWPAFTVLARPVFFDQFSAVVRLEIYSIVTATFTKFVEIISAFRSLEALLIFSTISNDRVPPPPTLTLPPRLYSLQLGLTSIKAFCDWLSSWNESLAIRDLSFYFLETYNVQAATDLLSVLGPRLEKLQIFQRSISISLQHNHNLRWIRFHLWNDDGVPSHTETLVHTLSQVGSTQLSEIRFKTTRTGTDSRDANQWRPIDVALCQPQFSTLQRAVFEFPWWDDPDLDPMPWLAFQLPQCHARGILFIDMSTKNRMLP